MKTKELELSEKVERRLEMIHAHPKLGKKRAESPQGAASKKRWGKREQQFKPARLNLKGNGITGVKRCPMKPWKSRLH
jgi:hypothetical protein